MLSTRQSEVREISRNRRFKHPAWCKTPSDDFSACAECGMNSDCSLQTCYQILVACKGFYYTYRLLLSDTRDPIFVRTAKERKEKLESNANKGDQPPLMYAIVANGAMAAELALKYLAFHEHHEFAQSHKLDVLLAGLAVKDREAIQSEFELRTGVSMGVFKKSLEGFSNAFNEARYFFSYGNKGISFHFDDFVRIVCEYASNDFLQGLRDGARDERN